MFNLLNMASTPSLFEKCTDSSELAAEVGAGFVNLF